MYLRKQTGSAALNLGVKIGISAWLIHVKHQGVRWRCDCGYICAKSGLLSSRDASVTEGTHPALQGVHQYIMECSVLMLLTGVQWVGDAQTQCSICKHMPYLHSPSHAAWLIIQATQAGGCFLILWWETIPLCHCQAVHCGRYVTG
jgi:hypothetical protein